MQCKRNLESTLYEKGLFKGSFHSKFISLLAETDAIPAEDEVIKLLSVFQKEIIAMK